jgi:TetR/AcrR family transcriptional repressor of nem operon
MPRSPEFDRDHVIEAAQAVFWDRGYSQTSVADLVEATGLKPGSLYGAFGSKKGVFLEVLDAYNAGFVTHVNALSRHESGALAGLITILDTIIDDAVSGADRRGCLAVNALLEMSRHDDDIKARLHLHNQRTRTAFATLVKTAQIQGDIDASRDPEDVAAFLMNCIWGLRVTCRDESSRDVLNGIAAAIIAGLGNQQQKARIRISPAR